MRFPSARRIGFGLLEQLGSESHIARLRLGPGQPGRRRVDEHGIAVVVQEHGSSYLGPGGLFHKLEFIQDQVVGVVAAQRVGVPGGFGPDALLGAGEFEQVPRLVLVDQLGVYEFTQGVARFGPEGVDLFLRRGGVEDAASGEEPLYGPDGYARGFASASSGPDNDTLRLAIDEGTLFWVWPFEPDGIFGCHVSPS